MTIGLDGENEAPQWIFKAAGVLGTLFAALAVVLVWMSPNQPEVTPILTLDRPQLVVFESQSCGWCRYFREKVAPTYEQSHLERRAPLRYVDIARQRASGYRLSSRVSATPTFVLVDVNGQEVSRLRGVPTGRGAFEAQVEKMLAKLPRS